MRFFIILPPQQRAHNSSAGPRAFDGAAVAPASACKLPETRAAMRSDPRSLAPLWASLPEVPGLKVRVPLLVGYLVVVVVHWGNAHLSGVTSDAAIFARFPTAMTPAPWGAYAWGAIYAYQGLGCVYAMVPNGYRTNGVKERAVRAAGACWPFAWLCTLCAQWCLSQERMIASALFLQGCFAGNAVAMLKLWPLAQRASPLQRWAYVTPSCLAAAWSTLQSGQFCLLIGARKGSPVPEIVAPLLCAACTALGLAVLWVPLAVHPQAPPMSPYGVLLVYGFSAIAAQQQAQGLGGLAAFTLCCAALCGLSVLAVSLNYAMSKSSGGAESTPLVAHAHAAMARAQDSYDTLETVLLGCGGDGGESWGDESGIPGGPSTGTPSWGGNPARAVVPPRRQQHPRLPGAALAPAGAPSARRGAPPVAAVEVPPQRHLYEAERAVRSALPAAAALSATRQADAARDAAQQATHEWQAAKAAAAAAVQAQARAEAEAASASSAVPHVSAPAARAAQAKLHAHAAEQSWREAKERADAAAAHLARQRSSAGYARGASAARDQGAVVVGTVPFYRGGAGSAEWQRGDVAASSHGDSKAHDLDQAELHVRAAHEHALRCEAQWQRARQAAAAAAAANTAAQTNGAASPTSFPRSGDADSGSSTGSVTPPGYGAPEGLQRVRTR